MKLLKIILIVGCISAVQLNSMQSLSRLRKSLTNLVLKNKLNIFSTFKPAFPRYNANKPFFKQSPPSNKQSAHATNTKLEIQNSYFYGSKLIEAIRNKDLSAVASIIGAGHSINFHNSNGWTPLISAICVGDMDIFEQLIEIGIADPNLRKGDNYSSTPLMIIARYGGNKINHPHLQKMTERLIERGARISARDKQGSTALIIAAKYGNNAMAKLLVTKSAGVNDKDHDGNTALMYAVLYGNKELVHFLLANKADIFTRNNIDQSVFLAACEGGNLAIVKLLLEKNNNFIFDTTKYDKNALHYAIDSGNSELIEFLIGQKIGLEQVEKFCPPLVYAIMQQRGAIARLLIDAGVNIQVRYRQKTPLMYAIENKLREIVLYLIEKGVNIDDHVLGHSSVSNNETALMLAVKTGDSQLVHDLIGNGANVHAQGFDGETALSIALKNNFFSIAQELINSGAREDIAKLSWTLRWKLSLLRLLGYIK